MSSTCMARPLRLEIANGMYHITSRGNRRRTIYMDDRDRRHFLSQVSTAVDEFGWLVHAYCLMPNHYHLLVETPLPNLSMGMKKINGLYAQAFNLRHGRTGHVFQGRFHSILVDKDDYLLRLSRYIVLNPVRAKLVALPEQWAWSSYRAAIGTGPRPRFLVSDQILGQFGSDRTEARRGYISFVTSNLAQRAPWDNLLGGAILGSEDFLTAISRKVTERESRLISRVLSVEFRPELKSLFPDRYKRPLSQETVKRARHARLRHGYTFAEIAHVLGIHQSTLTKAMRKRPGSQR
ncbi:transposase [Candidatus Eisenbacteria bacterium]|uniref:Transposase n=1 Tax=Eiseniibacteriota bacterium TaxID=2212470 RepID=A0ABV6YQU6_UNCEI